LALATKPRRFHNRNWSNWAFHMMAAAMIAAIDRHIAHAGCAHLAEGDFGGGGHGGCTDGT
jgi:hypothetical protein